MNRPLSPKIAFIGTGIMGLPMARNLLAGGFGLSVWNRTAAKTDALINDGARLAKSPADAASEAEFVVVMVGDGAAADAVLFGADGVTDSVGKDATIIVCSTLTPALARQHAKRCNDFGVGYLDAPVSGGERGAVGGELVIMVGGERSVFARSEAVLCAMGKPKYIGKTGCGQLAKLANQAIVGATIAAVAEALIIAQAGGGDGVAVREALLGGFANSEILRQHGARMLAGDFAPGGPAKYQLRDLKNAAAEAKSYGVQTPLTETATRLFEEMIAAGYAEADHSALYEFLKSRDAA